MKEKVLLILSEYTSVPKEEITEQARLTGDLGITSLDELNMLIRCEDEFGVRIDDRLLPDLQTVGDVLKLVESMSGQGK